MDTMRLSFTYIPLWICVRCLNQIIHTYSCKQERASVEVIGFTSDGVYVLSVVHKIRLRPATQNLT